MENKIFTAEYTQEAINDLKGLDKQNQKRVFKSVMLFEILGKDGVNSRPLDKNGLFEIKSDKVRIYFMYQNNKVVIIGLITLKKSQKAPERYIKEAHSRIERYLFNEKEL